jgi:hypothetical protein
MRHWRQSSQFVFVTILAAPWRDQGWVGLFAEGKALHTSRTRVTQTWDHRALARSPWELVTLI